MPFDWISFQRISLTSDIDFRRYYVFDQARPTDAAYVVFKELSDELEGHLTKLDAIVNSELKTVNDKLSGKISTEIKK